MTGPGLSSLRGRRVVVVGAAASGLAATRVLLDAGAAVCITESRPLAEVAEAAAEAEAAGAEVLAGGHRPEHLDGADLVVASPGVRERADVLRWAHARRLPVWGELEVGARVARAPYLAVTGTNGKTTTTEMLTAILRREGLDAVSCGNIGYPFSLAATGGHDVLVVEASSFQLRFHRTFAPRVSVLLNLAPDHLDWHGSFGGYRDAKRRVFDAQGQGDVHVGNRDDAHAAALSREAPCRVAWFTLAEPRRGEAGYVDGELVLRLGNGAPRGLGRPGVDTPPLLADAAAAAAAAASFGAAPESAAAALSSFGALPHRGEVVAEVSGIRFVDDSKATNPHAALASLAGRHGVVLVAGGRSKGIDLSPLAAASPALAAVVALGEAAPEVAEVFDGRVPVRPVATIEEAVEAAYRLAPPGGTVLLAPACASQDMFRDYQERGDRFARAAGRLAAGGVRAPVPEGREPAEGGA